MRKIAFALCLVALLVTPLSGCAKADNTDGASIGDLHYTGEGFQTSFCNVTFLGFYQGSFTMPVNYDCSLDYVSEYNFYPIDDVRLTVHHGAWKRGEYGQHKLCMVSSDGTEASASHKKDRYSDDKYVIWRDVTVEESPYRYSYYYYSFNEELVIPRELFGDTVGYVDIYTAAADLKSVYYDEMKQVSEAKRVYYKTDGETVELSLESFETN